MGDYETCNSVPSGVRRHTRENIVTKPEGTDHGITIVRPQSHLLIGILSDAVCSVVLQNVPAVNKYWSCRAFEAGVSYIFIVVIVKKITLAKCFGILSDI